MTDYYPHHSNYDYNRAQQPFSDPTTADEFAIKRTATHGSHQSQSHASTRSWVHSNQIHNPPYPPQESVPSVGHTPFHGPRPLPEHAHHHHSALLRRQFHNVPEEEDEDEDEDEGQDEYMPLPQGPPNGGRFHFAHRDQPPAHYFLPPQPSSEQSSPVPTPRIPANRDRSFKVGGFFKGLKRLPRMFRAGRDKTLISPLGTETDITGLTTGNTLPRYLSNPSIGPTNPQFAHRLSQAVANGSVPADISPAAFQLRPALVSPQQPQLMVTPSSDGGAGEEQQAEFFEGPDPPSPILDDIPRIIITDSSMPNNQQPTDPMERATMMVYRDSEAPPVATLNRNTSVPRVSYPAELPTRASIRAQMEPYAPIPVAGPLSPMRSFSRPGPQSFPSSRQTSKGGFSQPTTSGYSTATTAPTSYYDPSFGPHLTPFERFCKGFYHLPWISQGRVTVDYRPGDSPRAKGKLGKSLKKPLSSWYYNVLSRSRRNSVITGGGTDVQSNVTGSTTQDSNLSSLTSTRRSGRHHGNRSPRSKNHHHHRSRRRQTTSTTSTYPSASSSYPYAVPPYPPYPYPYMAYSNAPPPGAALSPGVIPPYVPPPSSPRGSRSHRRNKRAAAAAAQYPHGGYVPAAPYQPFVMPGPQQATSSGLPPGAMYYFTPSPLQHNPQGVEDSNNHHHAAAAPGGAIQLSPVLMHYVPAALRPSDGAAGTNNMMMVSPPATPQRPSHAPQNSHHAR